ncbi:MAG: N(4)-(beta-N-acetylglucosaminyl)-L-asparaginase [Bryobacteraceae bacterium]|nr:N(4)-(beta-N-acetylglucosaminyl)-L-asparaginase [Bryobacteraceae bacterium]
MLSRRDWFLASAAMPAAASFAQTPGGGGGKEVVISSANGLAACDKALAMIRAGGDTLDAVVAGVNIVEDDPEDNSVGYGGLPNELGIVELDASVMHGPTARAGSVASIQNIKNPSKVAKLVMEQTDHIMLVGNGALQFAKAWGFPEENLLTEKSRLAWLVWKQSLRDSDGHNNWTDGVDAPPGKKPGGVPAAIQRQFPHVDEEMLAWAWEVAVKPVTGTINCLALNRKGEMSGVTTTSGLSWKIPGRVGDSPVVGAGLFVDQEVGAAGSTGRGEENIRIAGAHTIVENMRHGMSPKDACMDALKRISRNYGNDLKRLAQFDINFYALRKDGAYAGASLWNGMTGRNRAFVSRKFAVADGGKSKVMDCAYLYERKA